MRLITTIIATTTPNNGDPAFERKYSPTISPIIKGIEKMVIKIAPPKAVTFTLPLLIAPFQALKTENKSAATPILQKDTQNRLNICSPDPDNVEINRIRKEIKIPMRKYFRLVRK